MVEGVSGQEVEKQGSKELGQSMPPRVHPHYLFSPKVPHTLRNLQSPKNGTGQQAFHLFEPVEDISF